MFSEELIPVLVNAEVKAAGFCGVASKLTQKSALPVLFIFVDSLYYHINHHLFCPIHQDESDNWTLNFYTWHLRTLGCCGVDSSLSSVTFKNVTHILFWESPPDLLGHSERSNHARRDGLSTVKCQRTRGVAFQNKLAFLSRTGSPVCLGRGRWKKRSWHLGWRAYLFLHLHPWSIEAVSEFCFRGTAVSNALRGSLRI